MRAIDRAFIVVLLTLLPFRAAADPGTVVLVRGEDEGGHAAARVRAWSEARGRRVVDDPRTLALVLPKDATTSDLDAIARIEATIARASDLAAQLDEGAALRELAEARRALDDSMHVAGIAGWIAEVETRIGIVAAQSGHADLAHASFRRALVLDPTRRVRPAELAPDGLRLFEAAAREIELGPRGSLTMRCDADGAHITLDDHPSGSCPTTIETTVGRHVLRVVAPGRRVFARLVDVREGNRSEIDVALARTPQMERAEALASAIERQDAAHAQDALGLLGLDLELVVVEAGAPALHRAAWVVCDARRCTDPLEVERTPPTEPRAPTRTVTEAMAELDGLASWLVPREHPDDAHTQSHRKRRLWLAVSAAGIAVAAAAIGTGLALRPTQERLHLTVDFGDVGRAP